MTRRMALAVIAAMLTVAACDATPPDTAIYCDAGHTLNDAGDGCERITP